MIAFTLLLLLQAAPAEDVIVLSGARILRGDGREISIGRILIQGRKIVAIGDAEEAPAGAIDLRGKIVIPGMIVGASQLGIEGPSNEDGSEVTPALHILEGVDPRSPDLARARQAGVTAAFVSPGNRGVIGGLGAVIKTSGADRAQMKVLDEAALKAVVGPGPTQGNFPPRGAAATFFARRPTTRMGVSWELRKAFYDARKPGEESAARDVLRRALDGKLSVRIAASRVTDLETSLQILDELKLRGSLEEGQEAWKRADLLAQRKLSLLLRPVLAPASGATDPLDARPEAFTLLLQAGVVVALLPPEESKVEGLRQSLIFAVRHGATPAEALRAVTLTPAEILGVAERLGSLEPGKDADLVVLDGEPHLATSRVERVMIEGRWIERTSP